MRALNRRAFLGTAVPLAASLRGARSWGDEAARELAADVVIVGGGFGGCAAALAACRAGLNVVMTEETDWIGGQVTAQGVPPDEHPWIERFGCTRAYREYRMAVRAHYRQHYPLTAAARADPSLNPGNGRVSRICHEPRRSLVRRRHRARRLPAPDHPALLERRR